MSKPLYVVVHQTPDGGVDSVQTFKSYFDAERAFSRSPFRFNLQLIKQNRVRDVVVSSEVILRK
jgi:hypothetical protein